MSPNYEDILEPLSPFLEKEKTDDLVKLISLLEKYHPKEKIDREFQRSLKTSLIKKQKRSTVFSLDFPWFGFVSGVGLLCTSFFAVFGLWNIWKDSGIMIETNTGSQISAMYSEEKAVIAESLTPTTLSITDGDNPISNSPKQKSRVQAFVSEKASLDAEIADIQNDVMDMANTASEGGVQDGSPMMALMRTASPDIGTSDLSLPSGSLMKTTSDDGALPQMIPPSISEVLDGNTHSYPIPSYPSMMKLYTKDDPWTSDEIISRSGSGIITLDISTEKEATIIKKIEKILAGRNIIGNGQLTYAPLKKSLSQKNAPYALVPVISYRLDTGNTVLIPIVRGYTYEIH